MERILPFLPALCGACAGLLIGIGHSAAGTAMAAFGILASYTLRTRNWHAGGA